MPSAKLIKAIEKEGFLLEFPDYDSTEEIIIEILNEKNSRLDLSLSIFLNKEFDYKKIIKLLDKNRLDEFNKIIMISEKIYSKEGLNNNLKKLINNYKIKPKFNEEEFNQYYGAFKECLINRLVVVQKIIEKQTKLRLNLDLNKNLKVLFSPAKIKIMEKIFNHQKLTNTELKYYYRSISNIDKAVLTPALQDYLRIIELSRKFR